MMKFITQLLSFVAFVLLTAVVAIIVAAAIGGIGYYLYFWADQSGLIESIFRQFIQEEPV